MCWFTVWLVAWVGMVGFCWLLFGWFCLGCLSLVYRLSFAMGFGCLFLVGYGDSGLCFVFGT